MQWHNLSMLSHMTEGHMTGWNHNYWEMVLAPVLVEVWIMHPDVSGNYAELSDLWVERSCEIALLYSETGLTLEALGYNLPCEDLNGRLILNTVRPSNFYSSYC